MRMIYKIAKTELKTLFFSPVAWLVIVIFMVQATLTYTDAVKYFIKLIEVKGESSMLTHFIFSHAQMGLFTGLKEYLYLYIPLLTMGIMSREINSGSIKLLYSSPLTTTEIILGKFLSMMIYGLILVLSLSFIIISGIVTIEHCDVAVILSGCLGIYLLLCAYSAIGVFMSSLTSYQIVAALGTFVVLAFLNYVGNIWQNIDFIRDITYWLSLRGRADNMIRGLIFSEDILYFIVVIGLFLSFTIIRLYSRRQKTTWYRTLAKYVGVICCAGLLAYITSRPVFWLTHDATSTKMNSLSQSSQDILKNVNGKVTITSYVNIFDPNWVSMTPQNHNRDKRIFFQYMREKPRMDFEYIYYYKRIPGRDISEQYPGMTDEEIMKKIVSVQEMRSHHVLSPEEIDQLIDLSDEEYRVVRILEAKDGRKAVLRTFADGQRQPGESQISAAFKRITTRVPVIGFVKGHGERDIYRSGDRQHSLYSASKFNRNSMLNEGFDIVSIELNEAIPTEVDILVISDPRRPYPEDEQARITDFIDRGGNILFAGEPGRQYILNPLLEKIGVQMLPGTLICPNDNYLANFIVARALPESSRVIGRYGTLLYLGLQITMPGCAGLIYNGGNEFEVTAMLASDPQTGWNEERQVDLLDDTQILQPIDGEYKAYATMLALSRQKNGKNQRIIVLGDADCLSNGEITISRAGIRSGNSIMIEADFFWLSDNQLPMSTGRRVGKDRNMTLSLSGLGTLKFLLVFVVPFLVIMWGGIILIRRKGR